MFAAIDPETGLKKRKNSGKVLLHFGFEDTVVNHLLLLKEMDIDNRNHNHKLERKIDKSMLSRRAFTVQVMHNLECLILNFTDPNLIP